MTHQKQSVVSSVQEAKVRGIHSLRQTLHHRAHLPHSPTRVTSGSPQLTFPDFVERGKPSETDFRIFHSCPNHRRTPCALVLILLSILSDAGKPELIDVATSAIHVYCDRSVNGSTSGCGLFIRDYISANLYTDTEVSRRFPAHVFH
ncbi:hypothetical protein E2C01_000997 [Portunus trituberculatus]|uniref:Uncharacterized protein n=1 Tax=Portunus trituberculatus TaxID=210409 RepID=A0A5B7CGI2_PORTR|nr:hypothetical protein [Portunus trituberculatus]